MERSVPQGRAQRLSKVVSLGAKIGKSKLKNRLKRAVGAPTDDEDFSSAVVDTLGEMKGAALKIGQTLSLGASTPPDVRKVLGQLFSQAPALPFRDISEVLRSEFGTSADRVFDRFEPEPFAAASLGQVHRAKTKEGEWVAVKVQYPGVDSAVGDDLGNLSALVGTLGLGTNAFDGKNYLAELKEELRDELNYRRERERLEKFREYVRDWDDFEVPRAHANYSTGKVLTMGFLEGPTLHHFFDRVDSLSEAERFRIGEQLVRAVFGPFLLHRVIHADTHPGNFVVMPDGRLGILDFGSVKEFTPDFWRCYRDAIQAWVDDDRTDLLPLMRKGGFTVALPDRKARELLDDIADIAGRPMSGPYDFGDCHIVDDMKELASRRTGDMLRVRPPSEGILFFRALVGLTHNLRSLRAKGDFRPTVRELLAKSG